MISCVNHYSPQMLTSFKLEYVTIYYITYLYQLYYMFHRCGDIGCADLIFLEGRIGAKCSSQETIRIGDFVACVRW